MRVIVKMLIVCLVIIFFNGAGCADKMLMPCKTPDVSYPDLNDTNSTNILINAKKSLINYEIMKGYAIQLKSANEVCK